jgi:signal transduction histidine kinase
MDRATVYESGPLFVAVIGLGLFMVAASHHLTELAQVGETRGPLVAFALDGLPALSLVGGGLYLSGQDFTPENDWRVFLATVAGASIVGGIIGVGILVRAGEGRPISEPTFQLLIGATTGSIAGFVAGFFYATSMERATRASKAMSTLSFTNSVLRHDIKNDMTVVRGRARVIADADPCEDLVAESARTIDGQVDEVLDVIDSTSSIAETLSDDPDYEPIDVADITRGVASNQNDMLPASISVDAPESAMVYGNDAVRTVISNLVENGVEHNDATDPQVHVGVTTDAQHVILRVLDNGPGVSEKQKATLFDRRPDDTGGGGLHVVATLVENFGGEIRVEDNEPRGTVFVVEFPRV